MISHALNRLTLSRVSHDGEQWRAIPDTDLLISNYYRIYSLTDYDLINYPVAATHKLYNDVWNTPNQHSRIYEFN